MRNTWTLAVAFALLLAGAFNLLSRSKAPQPRTESVAERAREVEAAKEMPALAMAGLPKFTPPKPVSGWKPLPTDEESADKGRELSNHSYINIAGLHLKEAEDKFDRKHEGIRMRAISYLASAAHWHKNPEREAVLSTIEEALAAENAVSPSDVRQRRSIAGDKRELFEILLRDAPERAVEVEHRFAGTWLAPILKMGRARFEAYSRVAAR